MVRMEAPAYLSDLGQSTDPTVWVALGTVLAGHRSQSCRLPPPLWLEVEIGVTEPGFEDPKLLRHDWWDPKRPMQPPTPEVLDEIRQKGGRVVTSEELVDVLAPVHGWRWIKRRLCRSLNRWCSDE
jgi:hypothetical protein